MTGKVASVNPEAFKILEGKLYLNYSKGVQKRWMQDKQGVQQDLLEASAASSDAPTPAQAKPRPAAGTEGELYEFDSLNAEQHAGACPDCGSQLEFAEGCMKCHVCGFSECG